MRTQNRQNFSRASAASAAGSSESEHRDRWLLSYADLVTLLLALFIVLFAASDHERAKRIAESFAVLNSGQAAGGNGVLPGSAIDDALSAEKMKIETILSQNPAFAQSAKIQRTGRGLVISLTEAGFFNSGEAEISPQAMPLIDALGDSLRESETRISVEGHTDSTPISTARFPSNWELSAARATVVLSRLVARGIRPARLSAAGYGGEQPAADNSTPEGRAQNRRVDLVVLSR